MDKPLSGCRVALEVGHGYRMKLIAGEMKTYYDPGACAPGGGPTEHELGVYRAQLIGNILSFDGAHVEILDEAVPDGTIWERAKDFDCFVSLHLNSYPEKPGEKDVQGTETIIHPKAGTESFKLAKAIQEACVEKLKFKDRGVKNMRLSILGGIPQEIPACLSEAFFIDACGPQSPWLLAELSAFAIAQGIHTYLWSRE